MDVCVHFSSCGTLRDVVHSPLVGSTIVTGVFCVAESSGGWSFTPDGTYDSVWDCFFADDWKIHHLYFSTKGTLSMSAC